MAILKWDQEGDRLYETGVKNGVLYPYETTNKKTNSYGDGKEYVTHYTKAIAWNGLTAVTESPEGAEPTDLYADDVKYLTLRSAETFGATVEAYMYPDEFMECDGTGVLVKGVTVGQQARKSFGLSYVTTVGNDTDGNDYGYKLHIIYGATVNPSEKAYQTINDSPEAITFSWEMKTNPVDVPGFKKAANIVIDSTKLTAAGKACLKKLEEVLYGTTEEDGYLPMPEEIVEIFKTANAAETDEAEG